MGESEEQKREKRKEIKKSRHVGVTCVMMTMFDNEGSMFQSHTDNIF